MSTNKEIENILYEKLEEYYNKENKSPSIDEFISYTNFNNNEYLTPEKIKKWWKIKFDQPVSNRYALSKPKKYLPIFAKELGFYQIDLMEFPQYKNDNPNFYTNSDLNILCAIDINSRYAFARALKNKQGSTVLDAIKELSKEILFNIEVPETERLL